MYNHTTETETPREESDSPVIFVLHDKIKKVHPLIQHSTDWVSSNKG